MYEQAQRIIPLSSDSISKSSSKPQFKVLLIEDHPMLQLVNKKLLEMLDCRVDVAINGQQAIQKFNPTYDIIFLDIGLPDISGIEVCKAIRASQAGRDVPIIALTAIGNLVKEECLAAGINDVATKPVLMDSLENIIIEWIK